MKVNTSHTWIMLGLLMLVGLSIRLIHFEHTTFAYDQARDALQAIDIFTKDPIKLIGPTTDIPGLFHGPLYWYIISPVYAAFPSNPLAVKLLLTFLHLFNIPLMYFLGLKISKNRTVAFISAVLMTVSFEAVQYSRWLSNPTLANITVALFFYGLWLVHSKKTYGFGLMLAMFAISVQFQLFFLYLGIFILAALWIMFRNSDLRKIFSKGNIIGALVCLLFFIPFFVSELKFGFQGSLSLLGFLNKHASTSGSSNLIGTLNKFTDSLVRNIHNNIWGYDVGTRTVLYLLVSYTAISAWLYKKNTAIKSFLLLWFLSPAIIYPLEKNNAYFLNLGNMFPLMLLLSLTVFELVDRSKNAYKNYLYTGVIAVLCISNIRLSIVHNIRGEPIFSVQSSVDLQVERAILDWVYSENEGKEFAVNTVTNPLFINTTWAYMFSTYGKSQYNRMPFWAGDPIDGRYAGADIAFNPTGLNPGNMLYLIIEPGPGIPDEYIPAYKKFEDSRSRLVEERQFGSFTVQKRIVTTPRSFSRNELFDLAKGF